MYNDVTSATRPEFCTEIAQLVRGHLAPGIMQKKIGQFHEKDIALALTQLTREECQNLFRILSAEDIANTLEYTDNPAFYFDMLGIRQKTEVLSLVEVSTAVELLQSLPKETRISLLDLVPFDVQEEIQLVSSFDEDEIGSKMSTNFIAIPDAATVKEAMSHLVRQAAENDNISPLYVVDESKTFCGAIDLKDLIIAREGTPLSEITIFSYPYLYASAEIEDYAKLAGLSSEEDLAEPILQSVRKRMPWLCALLVMGLGVSSTVGLFESIVAQLPIIMCFQSLVLDMAGNVGTQSLAVAIRVLMDTQIGRKEKGLLVWKELRVGLVNGLLLGGLSFAAIGGYLLLKGNAVAFSFSVSGCLGIAMVLAMAASSLSGTVIPLFFKKVGVDPAVASGPLITTINDLIAVTTYYGLAWLILLNFMHLA